MLKIKEEAGKQGGWVRTLWAGVTELGARRSGLNRAGNPRARRADDLQREGAAQSL